ncbi:hypothetical protein ACFXPX_20235 [Kitasatospora sp. NPDC059146]|uniref:hypothetical protein n=1 Tax=Kitasatospora sp. NPDC059146 TaxID=3346741 RepID=UPI00369579AA
MTTHPLAVLRIAIGLSQSAYAQLIARTHAELGFGPMAARREKVSRWESGRIAPELGAQLAIARIHQVDREIVLRLGWPQWLFVAGGDGALLRQPWNPQAAVDITRLAAGEPGNPGPGPALIATGASLTAQIRGAVAALADGPCPPVHEGPRIGPGTLGWAETRIRTLEELEAGSPIPQDALHAAARAEYRLVGDLLARHRYDRTTGTRLFLLAARSAALCTWTSGALGEEGRAERYALAAIRAAAAAGAPRHTAAYLSLLSIRHLRRGDPRDALALLRAARAVDPRPTPRLAVILHTRQARALARLGEPAAGLRALEHAERALSAAAPGWDAQADPTGSNIDEEYLALARGHTWLRLGQPARALDSYRSLRTDGAPTARPPSPHAVARLRPLVEAQLAVGQVDEAAATVRGAVDRAGTLPPGLAHWFGSRLAPHADHPGVRELLDHLDDRSVAQRRTGFESGGGREPGGGFGPGRSFEPRSD